tara:strand:- start:1292 stop:1618 length:327 start_codon:yes stop_codon:yes gene_type:complete
VLTTPQHNNSMTNKTKYRKGHYIIKKDGEIYHIVKKAMHRTENTWGIYRQSKNEYGDGALYDYMGNKIWVMFGCGSWVDNAYENTYKTLSSALETLDSVIAYKKSFLR